MESLGAIARRILAAVFPQKSNGAVLVLVPHKPDAPAAELERARLLANRALRRFGPGRVVLDAGGVPPPARGNHASRQAALAAIRQRMVEKHLGNERWIFWVDSDVVDYPPGMLSALCQECAGGIAAPLVLMEGKLGEKTGNKRGFAPGKFYDVAGFVENGRWARFDQPYFDQPGPIYDLDSVGSCYVVAADNYREGARHEVDAKTRGFLASGESWPGDAVSRGQRGEALAYTEHYSVCAFVRSKTRPVRAFAEWVALHARIS
jgi:hypothetical protein